MNRTEPLAVVDRTLAAITRYERPDLDDRLRHARPRLLDDRVRVLVVGEFKQGKSMLVNGLVGAPVCPTFDDIATAVPTVVRHAEKRDDHAGPGRSTRPAPDPAQRRTERIEVPAEELAEHVCEQGNPGNREGWSHVEVGLPRPRAGRRPGAGGHPRRRRAQLGARRGDHGRAARAPTRCCWSPTPRRSTPAPELEFLRARGVGVPERGLRAHQDRPLPGVAAHRRARPGPPGHGRHRRAELFAVSSTLRWHAVLEQRRRAQRRVRLPGARRLPAQAGARPGRPAGPPRRGARRARGHRASSPANLRAEQSAQQNPEEAQRLIARADRGPGAGRPR